MIDTRFHRTHFLCTSFLATTTTIRNMLSWPEKIEQDQMLNKWFEDIAGLEQDFRNQVLFLAMMASQPSMFEKDFIDVTVSTSPSP